MVGQSSSKGGKRYIHVDCPLRIILGLANDLPVTELHNADDILQMPILNLKILGDPEICPATYTLDSDNLLAFGRPVHPYLFPP